MCNIYNIEKVVNSFKKDQLKNLILKTNKLNSILNKTFKKINKCKSDKKQFDSNVLLKYNNKLDVLIKNYEFLENELEEIIYNVTKNINDDNMEMEYSNEIKKIQQNIDHTKNVITPFVPYLLLYSIYLQNN
jgi:hypothetical protein